MTINPEKFQWRAPDTNTDGTAITVPLNYELGVANESGVFEPYMTIVGTLQTDGVYQAPISDAFTTTGNYTVALRTLANIDEGNVQQSEWTDAVEFIISEQVPNSPLEFTVL